ncbi:MAG: DNA polymerase III subunit beta [Deltaproteobacteria bacterium]|nr:DNA polymerase III subunit beta [Deltaproteobacteria bacterium]
MEFIAAKKDFNTALNKAQGIPEQKNLSSVMANVQLESVGKESVRLTAQSYEVTLVTTFPAEVKTEGQMALSGRSLFDASRMLPDAPVTLKAMDNDWAKLVAGRTDYKVPGILPANLPERQEPKITDQVKVSCDLLLEMSERVGFTMSADEGRPNLNGICMKVASADGGVRMDMVATDGHRLSRLSRLVENAKVEQALEVIIHRKGVNELKRFLADVDGDVTLGFQRNAVVFLVESGYLLVRQVELEYPDYMRVLPDEFKWSFTVDRSEIVRAVQRAAVVISAEKTPLIKLTLEAGRIQIMAQDPDKGDAHSEVDLEYTGEPLEIAFNNRYLIEALNALPGKEVTVKIKDHSSATALVSPEDEGILQLIMPVRV